MKWNAAKSACPSGYRLPTRQEFVDLLGGCDSDVRSGMYGKCSKCSESSNCSGMFTSKTDWYWSSSPDGSNGAWCVGFDVGYVGVVNINVVHDVRCMRPGP